MKAYTINGHKVTEGIRLEGREAFLFLGQPPPSLGWPNDGYVKVPIRAEDVTTVVQNISETLGNDEVVVNTPFLFDANLCFTGEEPKGEIANFEFSRSLLTVNGV